MAQTTTSVCTPAFQPGWVRRFCIRAFYGVFLLAFGWVVVNIACTTTGNPVANTIVACAMGAALWLAVRFGGRRLDALSPRTCLVAGCVALAAYAAAQLVLGWFLMTIPISDFDAVYRATGHLIREGTLRGSEFNGYFAEFSNNLGLLLLLRAWFTPLSWFGIDIGTPAALYAGTVLNILFIDTAIFFAWRLALLLSGRQSTGLLVLALCLLFAPYLLWPPFFYTDTLSLPFPVLALFLYTKAHMAPRRALWWCAGCGAAIYMGFLVKGSLAILLVAIALHLVFTAPLRHAWRPLLVMLAFFAGLHLAFSLYIRNVAWFDPAMLGSAKHPFWYWIAMASHGNGEVCLCERCLEIYHASTRAERNRLSLIWIRENYGSYTPWELVRFLTHKATLTWGRGAYESLDYLYNAINPNWTQVFLSPQRPLYAPLQYYCNAFNLMVLGWFTAGLWPQLRRGVFNSLSAVHLSIFGALLFFSFWETHARYVLNFTPLLLIGAALAIAACGKQPDSTTKTTPAKTP